MEIKQYFKNLIKKLPKAFLIRNIIRNLTGHYYSPLPSLKDIQKRKKNIFIKKVPMGIDMNYEGQLEKLRLFSKMHEEIPFYHTHKRIRFNIDNESFSYDDAPILHYMMRLLKPARVIEIGSGNSSACMLDTNDLYLNGKVHFTFIDISFKDLKKMLREDDYGKVILLEKKVQDVDLGIFKKLEANDILFVDSSHVIKIGSDVHTILFDILPFLNAGVYIHFHDIRYPFEYMMEDVEQRVYWNEAYIFRAFLQYNRSFTISFWLNYLLNSGCPAVKELIYFLPLDEWANKFNHYVHASHYLKDKYTNAGGSIWLTKTGAE